LARRSIFLRWSYLATQDRTAFSHGSDWQKVMVTFRPSVPGIVSSMIANQAKPTSSITFADAFDGTRRHFFQTMKLELSKANLSTAAADSCRRAAEHAEVAPNGAGK
jgi:hypothetical protein